MSELLDHVFVTIGNRRWCMCCDLFQSKQPGHSFRGTGNRCPNNVPAATRNRANMAGVIWEREDEARAGKTNLTGGK